MRKNTDRVPHSEPYKAAMARGSKRCSMCRQTLDVAEFGAFVSGNAKLYHNSYCQNCRRIERRARRWARELFA